MPRAFAEDTVVPIGKTRGLTEAERRQRRESEARMRARGASPDATPEDRARLERRRAQKRAWHAKHRESSRKLDRAYYKRNREKVRAAQAIWRATTDRTRLLAAKRVDTQRRRATLRRAPGRFSARDWLRLLRRHGGLCAYCHTAAATSADHVVPLSRGGSNFIGNILPACLPCNLSKGVKLLVEWRTGAQLFLPPPPEVEVER